MAHRILGLDLGHRVIKVAVLDRTLRNNTLSAFEIEAVESPHDDEERKAALQRLLARVARPDDVIMAGLPIAAGMYRVLNFPFSDDKSLRESVPFEFESHIPIDLEEVIIDHTVLRDGDGENLETEVLAVGMPRQVVTDRLALLKEVGGEPRQLNLLPLCTSSLLAGIPACAEGTTLLLDIGATGTDAVFYEDGRVRFVRSLSVGSDVVRTQFTSQFNVDGSEGDLLLSHALLIPPNPSADNPNERILYDATEAAVASWLREIRQTLAVWASRRHTRPDRLLITGGMSGMRGLIDHVGDVLEIPAHALDPTELPGLAVENEDLGKFGAVALALALQGTETRAPQEMNFRQGALAYEGDFKFLRKRLPQLAAFAVIVLCLLAVRTTIRYRGPIQEQRRQYEQLHTFSKHLTNKSYRSFQKFKHELARKPPIDLASYYPDISAIQAFNEITTILNKVTEPPDFKPSGPAAAFAPQPRLAQLRPGAHNIQMDAPGTFSPPRGGVRGSVKLPVGRHQGIPKLGPNGQPIDNGQAPAEEPAVFSGHKVELLSAAITRSKVTLRGDCDTQEALLAFQQAIEKHRCFSKVKSSSDRISFQRHKDWFRFNLRFEIACPSKHKKKGERNKHRNK